MKDTQQVIILVGSDRVGKTNIAKELGRLLDVSVFKASSEHKNFLGDHRSFLDELRHAEPRMIDFLRQTKTSVIFDRGYPCEKVYAEFYGRQTDKEMLRFVDDQHAQLGTKILFCTRKSFAGISDDLDPKLGPAELEEISMLYFEFLKWTRCETYTLYVDDEDLTRETSEVMQWLRRFD